MRTNIVIVGGGVMGLSIAWQAAKKGLDVSVYERGRLGGEASRASAGMIGPQSEALENDAYFEATLHSRDLWTNFAKELYEDSGVDFGYRQAGALHLAFGAPYEKRLEARYLWQKKAAGKVERLDRAEVHRRWPWMHPRVSCAFFAEGDYWLDNEALMDALEEACRRAGVGLYENTKVESVEVENGRVQGLRVDGRLMEAGSVVLAAGAWSSQLLEGQEGPKLHPVKGQMLEFDLGKRLAVDLPIHAEFVYLVPRPGGRLAVGATVEEVGFDKSLTGEGVEWLLQGAFETIPDLRQCEIKRLWAGLRPGASDGWPTLGPGTSEGLFFATGHYRRGILFAPLTAQALVACLKGETMPAAALAFAADRRSSGAASA